MKARSCTYRVVGAYFADMNAQLHFPSGKEKAFPGKHTYKNQHLNNSIKRNESLIISYTYLSEKKSLISYRSMEEAAPAAKRLARAGSFSGVWWKLGDAAGDPAAVERRLRAIGDEEAGVRAAIHSRQAAARLVRRRIAFASLSLEVPSFIFFFFLSHSFLLIYIYAAELPASSLWHSSTRTGRREDGAWRPAGIARRSCFCFLCSLSLP
ncbi:hypothetical protein BRADI_3g60581v3 [Brachypodium distachyon]|uniref:Uncharacterized protein n=1 Tax=Brachypodium distachyon TaxID=15368 RepID=A0A2K2D638_BRADI|nr:hypothetical protein BRADI_3g60581v3 [Brachypodium distachyon]PNT69736.1 hypothetical protein BRADI_3g60581v3 [Brachypodium distachyon]